MDHTTDKHDEGPPEETPEERQFRLASEYDAWWQHFRECTRRNRIEVGLPPDEPPIPIDPPDRRPEREPPVAWYRIKRNKVEHVECKKGDAS